MLDTEGAIAYDESGVKKLAATAHQCPIAGPKVDLKATLKYVNKELACAIGDPPYGVVAPEEYADLRNQMQGTKTAFKGGGIGLYPQVSDPKLPPTAKQLAEFAEFLRARQELLDNPETDPCTGRPREYSGSTGSDKEVRDPYPVRFHWSHLPRHEELACSKGGPP